MKNFLNQSIAYLFHSDNPSGSFVANLLIGVDHSVESDPGTNESHRPAACRHLAASFENPNTIELADHLAAIQNQLNWTEAPRGKLTSHMDDKHAMVQMIGPDAGYCSENIRFGAFLLAPDTIYPFHSHSAEEIYLPISGLGQWRLQDQPYESKQPGTIIHVRPWVPHAIRSGNNPLLMLWAWFGDIGFSAYQLESDTFDED